LDVRSLPHGERLTTSGQQAVYLAEVRERPVLPKAPQFPATPQPDDRMMPDRAMQAVAAAGPDFGHVTQDYVKGQVIVGFKPGTPDATVQALLTDALRATAPADQPTAARPAVARRIPPLHALVLQTPGERDEPMMA
jgi:hypothetical protein